MVEGVSVLLFMVECVERERRKYDVHCEGEESVRQQPVNRRLIDQFNTQANQQRKDESENRKREDEKGP